MNLRALFLPVFFGVCGGAIWYFNTNSSTTKLVFPLVVFVPGYEGDLSAQGELTWQLLIASAVLASLYSLYEWLMRPPGLPTQ